MLLDPSGAVVAQAAASYDVDYPHPGWAQQDVLDWRSALGRSSAISSRRRMSRRPMWPPWVWRPRSTVSSRSTLTPRRYTRPSSGWTAEPRPSRSDRRHRTRRHSPDHGPESRRVARRPKDPLAPGRASRRLRARCWPPPPRQRARRMADRRARARPRERLVDAPLRRDTQAWSPGCSRRRRSMRSGSVDRGRRHVVGTLRPDRRGGHRPDAVRRGSWSAPATSTAPASVPGGIRPGIVIDITGTAEPVAVAATRPVIDDTGLVETHGHADPRVWLVENPGFVSGGSVRWFQDLFGAGPPSPTWRRGRRRNGARRRRRHVPAHAVRRDRAALERPGARRVRRSVPQPRPCPPLPSVLEGCTFALRDIVDRLDAMGLGGDEIRVVGGGARSRLWLQMKADVTGRTVRVLTTTSRRRWRRDAGRRRGGRLRRPGRRGRAADDARPAAYEPDRSATAGYDDAYGRYRALFDAVEPGFSGIAA